MPPDPLRRAPCLAAVAAWAALAAAALLGFGLYGGTKPESFERVVRREPVFTAPMLFTGVRF